MATAQIFERQLKVATAGLEPDAINALLAKTAKAALAEVIASGEGSERYVRSVNGQIGAAEESVHAPGPIVYQFSYLEDAIIYGLAFAAERSPKRSGRYAKSWFAMVDGKPWRAGADVPLDAEIIITNDQPYHRKIEVGAMTMRVPPHVVEDTARALRRQFGGSIKVATRFVNLAGGWRLRRNQGRKGQRIGDPITYPAVVITLV